MPRREYHLEVEGLPPSLNAFYGGMHWTKRKSIVDEWHLLFLDAFRRADLPRRLECPISLDITQYCKGVVRDCDNAVIASKMCGDSLKEYGYIKDDGREYVYPVTLRTEKGKQNRTVIVIGQKKS